MCDVRHAPSQQGIKRFCGTSCGLACAARPLCGETTVSCLSVCAGQPWGTAPLPTQSGGGHALHTCGLSSSPFLTHVKSRFQKVKFPLLLFVVHFSRLQFVCFWATPSSVLRDRVRVLEIEHRGYFHSSYNNPRKKCDYVHLILRLHGTDLSRTLHANVSF